MRTGSVLSLRKNIPHRGSVLVAILAAGVVTFLLAVGFSISNLRITQAEQVKGDGIMLPLKMVAESGIHEAISSRMFPSSNRLSWGFSTEAQARASNVPATTPKPFFYNSSYVYNTANGRSQLVGRYQYVILGTNPYLSQQLNGTYVLDPALVLRGAFLVNIKYPVYIASRGIVCQDVETGNVAMDQLQPTNTYGYSCGGGTRVKTYTLIAKLKPNATAVNPLTSPFEVESTRVIDTPDQAIAMETPIMNRNGLTVSSFNFQQWWDNIGQHYSANGSAVPVALKYRMGDVWNVMPWPNGNTAVTLPPGAALDTMDVVFRGALDERSLFVASNRYSPKANVEMFGLDPLFAPATQAEYSGLVLKKGGVVGPGSLGMNTAYPGASSMRFYIYTECDVTDTITINDKLQMRDADGFLNPQRYTINFTNPCPPVTYAPPPV
jgi:hypothetical protein